MNPTPINRRRALTTLGTVSLGTVIAACGGSSSPDSSPESSTTSSASGATADGATASSIFDDAASCTLSPEQTEGPFYFDVDTIRTDIRENRDGVPLRLAVRVQDAAVCAPLADSVLDIWHCDAGGVYSGFDDGEGETFLRGAQVTNADGVAEFTTVYPGWYQGRTVHIHAKVHLDNSTLLTTQLYFPEGANDAVFTRPAYSSDAARDTTNADDSIFDEQMVMTVTEDGDGYLGVMTINVAV